MELARSLAERGFEPSAVAGAMERLEAQGLIDDLAAARSAVRLRGARYGRARVERELKVRGFSKQTAAEAFEAEGGAERENEELARLFRKLWKSRADLAPALRRRRVFEALVRRGFRPERISEIIRGWYEVD